MGRSLKKDIRVSELQCYKIKSLPASKDRYNFGLEMKIARCNLFPLSYLFA